MRSFVTGADTYKPFGVTLSGNIVELAKEAEDAKLKLTRFKKHNRELVTHGSFRMLGSFDGDQQIRSTIISTNNQLVYKIEFSFLQRSKKNFEFIKSVLLNKYAPEKFDDQKNSLSFQTKDRVKITLHHKTKRLETQNLTQLTLTYLDTRITPEKFKRNLILNPKKAKELTQSYLLENL